MEALFDLVLGNIVWVMIAIGALYTFLKKAAGGGTAERPARPPRRPGGVSVGVPAGGRPSPGPDPRRQAAPQTEEAARADETGSAFYAKRSPGSPDSAVEAAYGGTGAADTDAIGDVIGRNESEAAASDADKRNEPFLFGGTPDSRELIAGIVWSEVLGPPRAKRPLTYKHRGLHK